MEQCSFGVIRDWTLGASEFDTGKRMGDAAWALHQGCKHQTLASVCRVVVFAFLWRGWRVLQECEGGGLPLELRFRNRLRFRYVSYGDTACNTDGSRRWVGVACSEPASHVWAERMAIVSDLAKEPLSHAHSRPSGINKSPMRSKLYFRIASRCDDENLEVDGLGSLRQSHSAKCEYSLLGNAVDRARSLVYVIYEK